MYTEPTIISRAGWGARKPKRRFTMPTPTKELYLHHLAAEWHGPWGVRQTQNFHMDTKGWDDGAYSFLVDSDEQIVYEMRGAGVVGGHTHGRNSKSHAICVMGNFEVRRPSASLLSKIADLVVFGFKQGWWPDRITGGHRDAPGAETACPGNYLYAAIPDINELVHARLVGGSTTLTTDTPEDEMPKPTDVTTHVCPTGGYWLLEAQGGVMNPPDQDGMTAPFFGSIFNLPEEKRILAEGEWFNGMIPVMSKNTPPGVAPWVIGYTLVTNHGDTYHFPLS